MQTMAMNVEFYSFLLFLWLFSYFLFRSMLGRWSTNGGKASRLPPSPMALPIVGHLHLIRPLLHKSFDKLAKRYGPLIHLRLGFMGQCVIISSPDMAKEFLKSNDLTFASRPRLGEQYITEDCPGFSFSHYGPYWRFLKKLCVTKLFSNKKLEQTAMIRREEIMCFLGSLLEKSRTREKADMELMLSTLSNNIICRMSMSTRCSGLENEAEECRQVVEELIETMGKLYMVRSFLGSLEKLDLFGYGKKLKDANNKFMVIAEKILKEHEQKQKQKKKKEDDEDGEDAEDDLMDILLKISKDDKAEAQLTRYKIKYFFEDILAAGTETSSVTMQWALAELINHPTVLEKAREEIDSVVGKNRIVDSTDIPNLPYIQAVLKETLRLHPTAPVILRECTRDCTVASYDIPEKTLLFFNVWAIGRDPKYWESPLEFRPERFLNADGTALNTIDVKGQHFQLLPFGSGRRMCPGAPLALLVIQETVAAMVQCFDWTLPGQPIGSTKIDMKEKDGFTLRMAHPLNCIPVARCLPFTDQL